MKVNWEALCHIEKSIPECRLSEKKLTEDDIKIINGCLRGMELYMTIIKQRMGK